MSHNRLEAFFSVALLACAAVSIGSILLIAVFVSAPGLPLMMRIGPLSFLLGTEWAPLSGTFGILPMIAGSVMVTLGCLLLAVPLGVACAVYLAEFAPSSIAGVVRIALLVLSGIPSVVYGFYGLVVIVPAIREHLGGSGMSVLAGSVVLAIMVLPTIATISEDAIKAVPGEYREGSMALGATRWETVARVVAPAARSGIIASVVLGMGRAIGETMALIMVTGNSPRFPARITDMTRTLTGNIALEMGYAGGDHQRALFATGMVLLVFIMIVNSVAIAVSKAGDRRGKP